MDKLFIIVVDGKIQEILFHLHEADNNAQMGYVRDSDFKTVNIEEWHKGNAGYFFAGIQHLKG